MGYIAANKSLLKELNAGDDDFPLLMPLLVVAAGRRSAVESMRAMSFISMLRYFIARFFVVCWCLPMTLLLHTVLDKVVSRRFYASSGFGSILGSDLFCVKYSRNRNMKKRASRRGRFYRRVGKQPRLFSPGIPERNPGGPSISGQTEQKLYLLVRVRNYERDLF